ncbi:Scr1 family TA system antitoxin-like transcriptional regulator [Streptomyces lydicus]|uniref:Scr1 family TA system antitoxin-like transcriptional regulator n=1 Tax=Streptomyces lydicus TaxID=47763 RepID=UPI0010107877|nr:Scr1 family TA system antitoxin-like transcriptional regulator [Streptomyces lydicus]MCZ1012227.1 Scr1 family TA system antitoxin-like transcriptional regulator [Streptomyces lydicus]
MRAKAHSGDVPEIEGGTRLHEELTPIEATPSPIEIVTGVYLHARRKALGQTLTDVARQVGGSASAISRWERAVVPIQATALTALLRYYEADSDEIRYLVNHLPKARCASSHTTLLEHRAAGADDPNNFARRGLWDNWSDVADEGAARYVAVNRVASEALHYTMKRIPPGYRTPEYRSVITDPDVCPTPDEPVADMPLWLARVRRPSGQRRTLLLDETVLRKPVGGPGVMARQLRHLLRLMDRTTTAGPVTIRVLPEDRQISFTSNYHEVAELTIHGHRLFAAVDFFAWYETRSGAAQTLHRSLHQTFEQAPGHQDSYDLIKKAADYWAKGAGS